jgi:hypothetical protein
MLLDHALTEMFLAKDYTPMSAQRRVEVLREFTAWASREGMRDVESVTTSTRRRYVAPTSVSEPTHAMAGTFPLKRSIAVPPLSGCSYGSVRVRAG